MAQVTLNAVTKSYGVTPVLHGIDIAIADGEFVVLVGPSGCGKSTLLRMIAGLEVVSQGSIHIDGVDVTNVPPAKRRIAMVFQSYALYPHMTVRQNIGFSLRVAKAPKDFIEKRVTEVAKMLQLEQLLERRPAQLSGGQRQRVAIGRALVRDVDVFLFDEPLSNLDAKLRSDLRVEIKRLHQRLKNTMIYVTHDQIEALTLADRIAVMKGGVIQQLDEPHTIYNRPRNLFVAGFIGSPAMSFLEGSVLAKGKGFTFLIGEHEVPLAGYVPDKEVKAIDGAIFGVRPEHVEIVHEGDANGGATFPGVVELEEPMGADSLVWISFGGQTVSARVDSSKRFRPGDKVRLGFNLPMASLFDQTTENRM